MQFVPSSAKTSILDFRQNGKYMKRYWRGADISVFFGQIYLDGKYENCMFGLMEGKILKVFKYENRKV